MAIEDGLVEVETVQVERHRGNTKCGEPDANKRNNWTLIKMAARSKSLSGSKMIETTPKKTRQGNGQHTKYASTSRNNARKRYRGQGKG